MFKLKRLLDPVWECSLSRFLRGHPGPWQSSWACPSRDRKLGTFSPRSLVGMWMRRLTGGSAIPYRPHRWASCRSGSTVWVLLHAVHICRRAWRASTASNTSSDTPGRPAWQLGSAPGSFWWSSSCWTPERTGDDCFNAMREASQAHRRRWQRLLCRLQ